MTTDIETLKALRERCREAKEASREIDFRIAYALGWRFNGFRDGGKADWLSDENFADLDRMGGHWRQPDGRFADISESFDGRKWPDPPEWSDSVDAARALVERLLPGWVVAQLGQNDDKTWWVELRQGYRTSYDNVAHWMSATPALALIAAALSARIAEMESAAPKDPAHD
jgi:hypothetical protein